jgi:threonine dehydrogenase-like Zn-dependent dehydrogenase
MSPVEVVRSATGGRGADVALELVGSSSALRLAYDLIRPFGILSSIGVNTEPTLPFSPAECYDKNITFVSGRFHFLDSLPRRMLIHRML